MKPVISYSDFRAYLLDWIKDRKVLGLPGSNRWFAIKMGINSSSWLTSVLKGKKGLSRETANKLSAILKHSPTEARYFEILVEFNQARTVEKRNKLYGELNSLLQVKKVSIVKPTQYDYYTVWYHSAIRSLVGMYEISPTEKDYKRLALMVFPAITPSQARKSLILLERIGLISLNDRGVYAVTSNALASGEEIRSLGIANFQQETMKLAQEALDRVPKEERYIGTATVGVSTGCFGRIKDLLIQTSDRIAEMALADPGADRVYQINLQAFPLSKKDPEKGAGAENHHE